MVGHSLSRESSWQCPWHVNCTAAKLGSGLGRFPERSGYFARFSRLQRNGSLGSLVIYADSACDHTVRIATRMARQSWYRGTHLYWLVLHPGTDRRTNRAATVQGRCL